MEGIEHGVGRERVKARKAEKNQPQTSADRPFINHEEHEGHEEKIGSLRLPREAGCPDGIIGTNGKAPEDERKPAYFRPAGLPIPPLSDPHIKSALLLHTPVNLVKLIKLLFSSRS